jgi:hypothetical protein
VVPDEITCSGLETGNVFHDGYGEYDNAEVEVPFGAVDEPHLKGRTNLATVTIREDGTGRFKDVGVPKVINLSWRGKEFFINKGDASPCGDFALRSA